MPGCHLVAARKLPCLGCYLVARPCSCCSGCRQMLGSQAATATTTPPSCPPALSYSCRRMCGGSRPWGGVQPALGEAGKAEREWAAPLGCSRRGFGKGSKWAAPCYFKLPPSICPQYNCTTCCVNRAHRHAWQQPNQARSSPPNGPRCAAAQRSRHRADLCWLLPQARTAQP